MTHTINRPPPTEQQPAGRYGDDYADVTAMFAYLAQLPAESHQYRSQRERIIRRCLPMADHVARHFDRRGEALEDLTQVARLGLLNAVDRYDATKGANFVAFAVPTMMGEVRRYFRDHAWTMHVPRRIRDLHVQINKARTQLTQEVGRAPTAAELAATLGVDHDSVVECLIASDAYQLRSIDAPTGSDESQPQYVADTLGAIDEGIDRVVDRAAVRPMLENLPELERQVLHMRFFESLTQSQIAKRIGTSQMQVSRILSRTLAALRDELE
jgi:RNA polymerase sigma-B factor